MDSPREPECILKDFVTFYLNNCIPLAEFSLSLSLVIRGIAFYFLKILGTNQVKDKFPPLFIFLFFVGHDQW